MKSQINPVTEEEWELLNQTIHRKMQIGLTMTPFEVRFFCESIHSKYQDQYTICKGYHFRGLFLRSLDYNKTPEYLKLSVEEKEHLKHYAEEWENEIVNKTNHSSQTLQYISVETRKEIKKLNYEFSHYGFLNKSFLYLYRFEKAMLMSRFIHFKIVNDIFLGYDDKEFIYKTIFGDVYFTDYSLSHILFRHYAAGAKPYTPNQSFFSKDITISSIHKFIFLILSWITQNKIPIKSPFNSPITVKYKTLFYQLYLKEKPLQKKGIKRGTNYIRVDTFYPVNDKTILNHISSLKLHQVSKDLIIYEQ